MQSCEQTARNDLHAAFVFKLQPRASWRLPNWRLVTRLLVLPHVAAQSHQKSRPLPDGRSGGQAALHGAEEHREEVDDAAAGLESSVKSV